MGRRSIIGDILFVGNSLLAGVGVRRIRTLHSRPGTQYHVHSAHRTIVGQCTQSPQMEAGLRALRLDRKSASGGQARRDPADISRSGEPKSDRGPRRFWTVRCPGFDERWLPVAVSGPSAVKYLDLLNRWQELFEQDMPWMFRQGSPCPDSLHRIGRQATE